MTKCLRVTPTGEMAFVEQRPEREAEPSDQPNYIATLMQAILDNRVISGDAYFPDFDPRPFLS